MPIIPRDEARPQLACSSWTSADDDLFDLLALAIAVDVLREAGR